LDSDTDAPGGDAQPGGEVAELLLALAERGEVLVAEVRHPLVDDRIAENERLTEGDDAVAAAHGASLGGVLLTPLVYLLLDWLTPLWPATWQTPPRRIPRPPGASRSLTRTGTPSGTAAPGPDPK